MQPVNPIRQSSQASQSSTLPFLSDPCPLLAMARLMQPALLLGISLGVIFNVVFPAWLITVLLTILLFSE